MDWRRQPACRPQLPALAERLGYLPLALYLVGKRCRNRLTLAEYIKLVDLEGIKHLDLESDARYKRTVAAV